MLGSSVCCLRFDDGERDVGPMQQSARRGLPLAAIVQRTLDFPSVIRTLAAIARSTIRRFPSAVG